MDNETKLSKEQINSIRQELNGKKENIDINDFMERHLNDKQKQAFSSVISDPERLKAIINSPFAKKMLERFADREKE